MKDDFSTQLVPCGCGQHSVVVVKLGARAADCAVTTFNVPSAAGKPAPSGGGVRA